MRARACYVTVIILPPFHTIGQNAPTSEGLNHLRTNAYTLHHFETPTGLRFVLNTDNSMAADMRAHLRHIYASE